MFSWLHTLIILISLDKNSTEEGWNSGSFIELFKAKEEYPSLTTNSERSMESTIHTNNAWCRSGFF